MPRLRSRVRTSCVAPVEAPWQSGYAADCKSVDLGSIPGGASILFESSSL
ncbi:hypothetical protein THOD04_210087 [Vibrio owensii]|uniref:Uncharacterized protein n=1 Tax=Vibrio owensii TaxID=696485 RepID=A0AAU9Q598_9VIBR|nr:hypothetical protein THF1D04_240046 [Vibrio owensii]CAH1580526.1 hypothetical protein THOA03_460037 [Vibrio owensii]CAH1581231.1 hypothetical protein THOD04_210087 [Vibrio owensii]CAH1589385.1 hypothetical protein THZB04_50292 [Vibrio owensii]